MFGSRGEEDGYGEAPRKPAFNQLHALWVRIVDKVSSHGVRQKRAVLVGNSKLVVCEANSFKVKRVVNIEDIAGAYRQYDPKKSELGTSGCAVLLCIPADKSHDLLLLQPKEKKAGYANTSDMTELLRAITYAKSLVGKKLPVENLPRGSEAHANKDRILNHAYLIKHKDCPKPPTDMSLEGILKQQPLGAVVPKAESVSSDEGPVSPKGRKVSWGGVLDESAAVEGTKTPWEADDTRKDCNVCNAKFTTARRRHHCRKCGRLVCDRCSPHVMPCPGYAHPERVCQDCYHTLETSSTNLAHDDEVTLSSKEEEEEEPASPASPATYTSVASPASPASPASHVSAFATKDEEEEEAASPSPVFPRQSEGIVMLQPPPEPAKKRKKKKKKKKAKGGAQPPSIYPCTPYVPYVNPYVQQKMADTFWVEFVKEWDCAERAVRQYDVYRESAARALPYPSVPLEMEYRDQEMVRVVRRLEMKVQEMEQRQRDLAELVARRMQEVEARVGEGIHQQRELAEILMEITRGMTTEEQLFDLARTGSGGGGGDDQQVPPQQPDRNAPPRFCFHCGATRNVTNARFCSMCGTPQQPQPERAQEWGGMYQ